LKPLFNFSGLFFELIKMRNISVFILCENHNFMSKLKNDTMSKLAVVALGGNALLRDNERGTIEQQEEHARETIENLIHLIKDGYNLVITHGNGPQVGNILMRNDAGEQLYDIVQMPLNVCVADSQGGIGYMVERILRNTLIKHAIKKEVVTMVSMVEVSENDGSFENPSKRIGKAYNKEEADDLASRKGWTFKPSSKKEGAYRRVVPSPEPLSVVNHSIIKDIAANGTIVITAGGGGVPVYYDKEGGLRTVNGVIDKDKASSLLATEIHADELYILTDVPFIYKDYGTSEQQKLEFLNYTDAKKYLEEGAFGDGTMKPKIEAALNFIKNGGGKSVITEASKLEDKSFGSKITMEY
jgi:carbamate kinase